MDNILVTLILMLGGFVGVYLYMSKKLEHTDLTDRLQTIRNSSIKMKKTKLELEKIRVKKDLMEIFPELTQEERSQWLSELNQIVIEKNNAA